MRYVVSYSGGVGSFCAGERIVKQFGADSVDFVFCDTLIEHPDLYRFLDESARALGVQVQGLTDGRDPWEVFADIKYIGNTRVAPCSRILKRDRFAEYLTAKGYTPDTATIVLGMDWTEEHRFTRAQTQWAPFQVLAPMCDAPYLDREAMRGRLDAYGIALPALYKLGFAHNNCGGFCVRAGQAQFALLLKHRPDFYIWNEQCEADLIESNPNCKPFLRQGKNADGTTRYVTLRQFREHLEASGKFDKFDFGGCGCFVDDEKTDA